MMHVWSSKFVGWVVADWEEAQIAAELVVRGCLCGSGSVRFAASY
jgi:hypothetical protein